MKRKNSEAAAAIQYLTWALEQIELFGHQKAEEHTRAALDELTRALEASDQDGSV